MHDSLPFYKCLYPTLPTPPRLMTNFKLRLGEVTTLAKRQPRQRMVLIIQAKWPADSCSISTVIVRLIIY